MIKNLNIIKKLKSLLMSSTMTQDRIDTYRAAATLKFYKQYNNDQYNSGIPSSEQLTQLYKDLDGMSPYALSNYVHTNVYEQIIKIFQTIDFNEKYKRNHHNSRNKKIARDQLINDIKFDDDGEKIDKLNYELIVKKSMIENANDGMFLSILDHSESNSISSDSISGNSSNDSDRSSSSSSSRFIIPGTVIGVYPGQVYLKSHLLQSPSNLTNLLPDNDFMLMTRYDECIIDGRTAHTLPTHPYALCHKINHCGLTKPNVMQLSFDFPGDAIIDQGFPVHLRKYIPNKYIQPISFSGQLETYSIYMKAIVFISLQFIEHDDEILMDYRLDPKSNTLPSWYHIYDLKDSQQRWES